MIVIDPNGWAFTLTLSLVFAGGMLVGFLIGRDSLAQGTRR